MTDVLTPLDQTQTPQEEPEPQPRPNLEIPDIKFTDYSEKDAHRDSFRLLRGAAVFISARVTHRVFEINGKRFQTKLHDSSQFDLTDAPAMIVSITDTHILFKTVIGGEEVELGSPPGRIAAILAEEPAEETETVD